MRYYLEKNEKSGGYCIREVRAKWYKKDSVVASYEASGKDKAQFHLIRLLSGEYIKELNELRGRYECLNNLKV
jgi:hypothetical protein